MQSQPSRQASTLRSALGCSSCPITPALQGTEQGLTLSILTPYTCVCRLLPVGFMRRQSASPLQILSSGYCSFLDSALASQKKNLKSRINSSKTRPAVSQTQMPLQIKHPVNQVKNAWCMVSSHQLTLMTLPRSSFPFAATAIASLTSAPIGYRFTRHEQTCTGFVSLQCFRLQTIAVAADPITQV